MYVCISLLSVLVVFLTHHLYGTKFQTSGPTFGAHVFPATVSERDVTFVEHLMLHWCLFCLHVFESENKAKMLQMLT